jgi:adenine-specific DNA-methyltransferase
MMVRRAKKKEEDVEAYRHETETRKNVVWTGKAENTSFEVPTVSLHIHERIAPE